MHPLDTEADSSLGSSCLVFRTFGLLRPGIFFDVQKTSRRLADLYSAWLHRFGKFTLKVYVQQTVFEVGTDDFNVIGEVEAALERTRGYATMQVLALLFCLVGTITNNQQTALLCVISISFSEKPATAMVIW